MKESLLWIDMIIKLGLGFGLVALPRPMIAAFGWPKTIDLFWPRLLGVQLVAVAAALFVEGRFQGTHGLGLAGAFAINLCLAFALATALAVGRLSIARRGRIIMWLCVLVLVLLSLFQLAWT